MEAKYQINTRGHISKDGTYKIIKSMFEKSSKECSLFVPTISTFPFIDYIVFSEGYDNDDPLLLFKQVTTSSITDHMRKGGKAAGELIEFCGEDLSKEQMCKRKWSYNMESEYDFVDKES